MWNLRYFILFFFLLSDLFVIVNLYINFLFFIIYLFLTICATYTNVLNVLRAIYALAYELNFRFGTQRKTKKFTLLFFE